jgi:GMP synthase-like glutamine amidotransferase
LKVIVFRHIPFEHAGLILPELNSRGLEVEHADLFAGAPLPAPIEEAVGLVFMGGFMSANDNLPFIRAELGLIERAARTGTPMLGVCLGAQLMAKALGGRVYKNQVKEIGWYPVSWTPTAAGDALFGGLSAPETVFQWHGETFDLPAGAVQLARSAACEQQAFRVGDNAYGLQFHLEVTPGMIAAWLEQAENSEDVAQIERPIDPQYNSVRLRELSSLVFGRWAELVCSR